MLCKGLAEWRHGVIEAWEVICLTEVTVVSMIREGTMICVLALSLYILTFLSRLRLSHIESEKIVRNASLLRPLAWRRRGLMQ